MRCYLNCQHSFLRKDCNLIIQLVSVHLKTILKQSINYSALQTYSNYLILKQILKLTQQLQSYNIINRLRMYKSVPMTFAGGPTYMPEYLKTALKQKMFQDNSYFNVNSNTKQFKEIVEGTRQNLRNILSIPNDRQIWFLGGGCHLQFAGIPLNFLGSNPQATANYTTTGYFSKLSFSEAQRYCKAKSISTLSTDQNGYFYLADHYDYDKNAVYTHFIENQSVEGLSYSDQQFPIVQGIPLFNDCSSSFLTRPINWETVDMAYAHAQKNAGISGVSIMILNERTLQTSPHKILPQLCSFQSYKKKNGYHAQMNILPIYANYITTKHISQNGGLNINAYQKRSKRLYEVIDKYKIYKARVRQQFRSKVTVTWNIQDEKILKQCLAQGEKNDLYQFKGHRSIGGCRASLFVSIPDDSAFKLADFLQDFAQKYQ